MNRDTVNQAIAWINSPAFQSDMEDVRKEIMQNAKVSENERQTADAFENALYFTIRNRTGIAVDFCGEHRVDHIVHTFGSLASRTSGRGKLDALVNYLVIEYKHCQKLKTKRQCLAACEQVCDYLEALYQTEQEKYQAVLTDGIKICYFNYGEDGKIHRSAFTQIEKADIETIVKAIVLNEKKKLTPKNIAKDFAISCSVSSVSKTLAQELYRVLKTSATGKTEMLYHEWLNLLHLSADDNGKSNDIAKRRHDLSLIFVDTIYHADDEYKALWALQTTYAIIVKLFACKVADKLDYGEDTKTFYDLSMVTSEELQKFFEKVEDGYSYRYSNISNFLEGDFFSWYSDVKQWNTNIYTHICEIMRLIDEYSLFAFNVYYEPTDIFKDLYIGIIPKSVRHSMGEYFTPEWLADCVIAESLAGIDGQKWKAIDPCCGSGIFVIQLIKHIVGNEDVKHLSETEKQRYKEEIISRVFGIDINPLSVLSARVGYYLALQPFGTIRDIEIPIYLGDSAMIPEKKEIDGIICYHYSVINQKMPFEVVLPERFVRCHDFMRTMNELQTCVKTNDDTVLFHVLVGQFSQEERQSEKLMTAVAELCKNLVFLHKNSWDGIWVRIVTNFMMIARLGEFDVIVGNPPWVKWEHLPAIYAEKIKALCNIKHIFSNDGGQFGGTQLNICALISNVTATNWLKPTGTLAFLMPDSIMSQNSYEEFRNFYLDYGKKTRLYLQKIDKWEAPLRPFRCDDKPVTQDFNTYYFASREVDYSQGIPVRIITRDKKTKDEWLNAMGSFEKARPYLKISEGKAAQMARHSTAFSYVSSRYDYTQIIGATEYQYRTGVEFTPQELYILAGVGASEKTGYYRFSNKKFQLSKYTIDDMPKDGWDLPTRFIYPIVASTRLEAFHYRYSNEYCILPYEQSDIKKPLPIQEMMKHQRDLFGYLVSHKELIDRQSEKSKQMHRGNEFYALSKIGRYTFAPHIVAVRDNTKFCAAVIDPAETAWGETKNSICVKHVMIISQDKRSRDISEEEAYYISGILNSDIVIHYMHDSFKKNGFSLNKSNLYLPLYHSENSVQKKISDLAKTAKDKENTAEIQIELSKLYLQLCSMRKDQ